MNVTTSCDRKHSPSTTGRLREASNRPPHRVAGVRRCHRGLAGVANQSEGLEVGWTADWASWGILSRFVLQIAGRTGVPTHAQWWTPLRCGSPRSARRPSAPGRPPLPGPAACSEKAAIGNPTCYPCCRFVLSPMFPAAQVARIAGNAPPIAKTAPRSRDDRQRRGQGCPIPPRRAHRNELRLHPQRH
jgi:hypothetical protein